MQIEHSNEIDLIRQTLAGDTSAFDQLVKTHRRTIFVLVLSYINNPADADDLTQRIFIRAYERLATLRKLDHFLPWLQQIAHNACKDWLRGRSDWTRDSGAVNEADFTETAPSPEELALKREVESVVREAISTLKDTDRKLIQARYIEGASYDELQVESGLSYAAIANRLKRAKQQMRRRIEKLLGGMIILPGRPLIRGGIETVKISAKTKLVSVGTISYFASLLLHIISILLVVHFLNPESQYPVADAVSLHFFDINNPQAKRPPTNTKRMAPIRKAMGGSQAPPNLTLRPIQWTIPAVPNQLPAVGIGAANIGLGHGVGDGDGDGLNGGSFLAEPVKRPAPVRVQIRQVARTGSDVLPPKRTEMNRSVPPLETDISPTQPHENPINVDSDQIVGRDKVDVVFIISAQWGMDKYFGYLVSLVDREIQHYKKSGKDYHVGIMRSGFRLGNGKWIHQIEYLPLNSDLATALAIARKTEVREDASDILLNTVRYALDRCVFRPNATRRVIVIGNDIPICGGYSALSIIELCRKNQVILDIHGADKQVGPLLAHETGGRWYPALENPDDLRRLGSKYIGSPHWKIRITLDTVVEVELGNRSKNR